MTKSKLTLKLNIVTAKMPKSVKEGDLLITTKTALYHFQQEKCNKIGTENILGLRQTILIEFGCLRLSPICGSVV